METFLATLSPAADAVAIQECIFSKGSRAQAGSKMLDGFTAPFDAAVVEKLQSAGLTLAGVTAMDEFSLGSTDKDDAPCAAVQAVLSGSCCAVLCNDLSGKVRRAAAENGMVYLHPSYGTVSRCGLIPSVCSMDQIGVLAKTAADCFRLLAVIAGHDSRDGTSLPQEAYSYTETAAPTLAAPKNFWEAASDAQKASLKPLVCNEIELPYTDCCAPVQYILSAAELSNNINRYDGIKFGHRSENYNGLNELYVNSRTEGFGKTTKLAAIMGAYVLSQEQYTPLYEKAMRLRRRIRDSLDFAGYDILVLPASCAASPYEQSALAAPSALAGLPCLAANGLLFYAAAGNENALYTLAKGWSE